MNLDEMLSQPLPDVPDDGFSARVIVRVKAEERRKNIAIVVAGVTSAVLICLLLPLHAIIGDLAASLIQIATSPMIGLATAACVLTFLIDRILTDRQFLRL
jgi:hypothetical protein